MADIDKKIEEAKAKIINIKDEASASIREAVQREKKIKHGNGLSTGEGEEAGDFMGTGNIREKE